MEGIAETKWRIIALFKKVEMENVG